MAAVLALVMVPLLASLGFFVGVTGDEGTLRSGMAMATFALLGSGMLYGLLRFLRGLEE
jgi:hypothetical protein